MDLSAQHLRTTCFLCDSARVHYAFIKDGYPICECDDCGFLFLNPQPSDAVLAEIYSSTYFLMSESPQGIQARLEMKAATSRIYLDELLDYRPGAEGKLLEIGCGDGEFLVAAQQAGFDVTGVEMSAHAAARANERVGAGRVLVGDLEAMQLPDESFDVCAAFDAIEHVREPIRLLREIRRLLKPGGVLFLVTPSLDSWSSRLMRQNWMEFKAEHLHYFNTETIQNSLCKTGFGAVYISANYKAVSLEYVHSHFQKVRVPFYTRLVAGVRALLPHKLRSRVLKISGSGMNVICRKTLLRTEPLLSVILPAFNEKPTFDTLMQALVSKQVPQMDKEIVIVESNSTDGTREAALRYENTPGVTVVLEDRPQGKGHAVRNGLQYAKGDFILIQDGDLEYDLNDYDQLLEPLARYRRGVVLGSRHGGGWKIRRFEDQRLISLFMNVGDVFFRFLLNLFCGTRLQDPFTMYKVFRRDCLFNLHLKANRFDFDWELIIKLIRKGYVPLELPVNYRSRSFKDGKKISLLRDPLTWLAGLLGFRFGRLYERAFERGRTRGDATAGAGQPGEIRNEGEGEFAQKAR